MATRLVEHLDPEEFDVKLALLRTSGDYIKSIPPHLYTTPGYKKDYLDIDDKGNASIFKLGKLLRAAFLGPYGFYKMLKQEKPDVVMSFCKGTCIAVMFAVFFYGRKKLRWIVREGSNTWAVLEDELKQPLLRRALQWLTYKCFSSADVLLSVSRDLGKRLEEALPKTSRQNVAIHNAVDVSYIQMRAAESVELPTKRPYFIGIGRIQTQKGFDYLIESYSNSKSRVTHDLIILGKGPHEEQIKDLIRKKGLQEQIHLLGWRDNPWAYIAKAEAFVLSSRWEGIPNIAIEALACGVPLVATDCDFGPREIFEDHKIGFLLPVDDQPKMISALDQISSQSNLRAEFAEKASLRVRDFRVEEIVQQYAELLRA